VEPSAVASTSRIKSEVDQEVGGYANQRSERRSTPRASPTPSMLSRSSAHGSVVSLRRSPGQASLNRLSNSTVSEAVDMDSMTVVSSSKRASSKRKVVAASDDEIEIVEGPIQSRSTKKPRARASTKTRAKKR
jgi:mediator of RNA polymerase II transcription subunit 12